MAAVDNLHAAIATLQGNKQNLFDAIDTHVAHVQGLGANEASVQQAADMINSVANEVASVISKLNVPA